ncbi:YihY/virulence factor BrkB family protein [Capillimicrobium parvum]|uniref:YihY/virulence factor BrkB family protein n=1 Tax=Capillimicrobium parvum TaxID=2884022 RepID=UPI00216B22FD|nr:YihY/virulence factor BrkB family protein [Capillimicrobium parvum]
MVYKFADDQGGYLAALITYYGFLSLFPLLLLLATILAFALHGDPHLQARLLDSALAQFPVISSQLRENVHANSGSGLALVIGIVGALYGCLGAAQATQNALNRAWAVPRNVRPNPIKSRLRSLLLVLVLGLGVLVTTGLSGLTTGAGALGASVAGGLRVGAILIAALANIALFMLAFRVLTAREIPTRHLRLGAVVAGIGWQIVQLTGTYFVSHALKGTRESYGVFALVLGLLAWIYVLALVTVVAAEINVVAQRRLWPRALLTPFTDDVQLTSADKRSYTAYAESERHKGFQTVDVDFQPEQPSPHDEEETGA